VFFFSLSLCPGPVQKKASLQSDATFLGEKAGGPARFLSFSGEGFQDTVLVDTSPLFSFDFEMSSLAVEPRIPQGILRHRKKGVELRGLPLILAPPTPPPPPPQPPTPPPSILVLNVPLLPALPSGTRPTPFNSTPPPSRQLGYLPRFLKFSFPGCTTA